MIEFFTRLVSTMEHGGGYMYRHRAHMGQLIGMAVLAIICYQFTVIGDNVYVGSMTNFILNSTSLVQSPLYRMLETNALITMFEGVPDIWDINSWLLVIVKVIVISSLIAGYAILRGRKYYPTTVMTGVFHTVAYGHLVVGVCMLSLGLILMTVKVPVILTILLGLFLMIVCMLLAVSLFHVTGRIIGACSDSTNFEGLLIMVAAYIIWIGLKIIGYLLA